MWLNGIMQDLGFKSGHYFLEKPDFGSTSKVDMFDYISDTPTSSLTWQLVQSHPKALFLMTMRDPVEWRDSRIKDHIGEPDLTQGLPCGVASLLDANNPAAETYVAYSAWAKCVIPEDRFLAAVNVFADENNDAEFVEKLIHMLETHGLQKPGWKNRTARVRANVALS